MQAMIRNISSFIEHNRLFLNTDRILLAVSGGLDSVVMAHLFYKKGLKFGIAHCNFGLRGKESEGDEDFTRSLAEKMGVPFFVKHFNTTAYASLKKISVQMAARELRYEWFGKVRVREKYDFIATAHHLDDQEETFFINLMRSSGLAGFHGIAPKKERLIRPLLFASRKEIEAFVKKNNIPYREDRTNRETKYLRNKIRHDLIPVFRNINPQFSQILNENIGRLKESEIIFRAAIEKTRKKIVRVKDGNVVILIRELKKLNSANTYLYEFLAPFDFNFPVCRDIVNSLDETETKQFYSSTHHLVKERDRITITPVAAEKRKKVPGIPQRITEKTKRIVSPVKLVISRIAFDPVMPFNPSPDYAYLDCRKLTFPLTIRKWQKGDHFYPFGNSHRKKLSDYFTDKKFSMPEKEDTWLLCSGEKIIWVIGYRSDNRFRVTKKTGEVLVIHREE